LFGCKLRLTGGCLARTTSDVAVAILSLLGIVGMLGGVRVSVQAQKAPEPVPAATAAAASPDPGSRTIRVDAIVTDKHGAPIAQLLPQDFTVLENGVEQKIDRVEWRTNTPPAVGPIAPPSEIRNEEDERLAAKEPGTRLVAIYLDEYHVSAGPSTERVRVAVARFIDEQIRPGDLLVVMKPLDHLTEIRFTRDRDAARRSVSSFTGRRNDYTPRNTFEEQYLGKSPAAARAARAQIVMSGLRALATRMGEMDGGLGGIVLMSEGFTTDVPRGRERRLPDLPGLVRASSRFRVLLYAFDPGDATSSFPAADGDADVESSAVLQGLARQTGGDGLPAGQDLGPAFQRVSRDLDSYYVLTFTSTSPTDGRFHGLQITSKRRDAQVRARSGYWAPLPSELRAATRLMTTPLLPTRALKRSPYIESWFGLTVEPDGQRRVIFTWMPAASRQPARSKPNARPDVVALKVTTPSGALLFEGEVVSARSGTGSSVRPSSAVFQTTPGRLQFDLTILQADGTRLDVGAMDFEVPGVRGANPVILPPQVFRAQSAREFRDLIADVNAAPVPDREFRRTERLLLRVPTFEPAGNAVQVSAKLVNRVGTLVLALTPMPPLNEEAGQRSTQFDLPLARFAPGEYLIEVAAQSDAGTARELIRFRITG
jgi:VWFA-related protein